MSDVKLRGVWKRYTPDVVAVKSLDLEISAGELVVLVGPSGCGKTTTLRMVAGLETISEGDLHIGGHRMNAVPPRDRDIAMVFQSYALYPHMTVYENMAFGLRLRKTPNEEIRRRVEAVGDTLGLRDLLHRKPRALSGGQRQRVAMGRAIVREPSVFLFDEPLSNLDAKLRHEMRLEIARLHRALGATILYVTHDQVEAMTLADRIAIMKDGELQQYGPPMTLYTEPANRFVAGFLGSPSMNFLEGQLDEVRGQRVFRNEGFELPIGALSCEGLVTIGLRPQAFRHVEEGALVARVEIVEPLGSETYVHFRWGTQAVVAQVSARHPVQPGDVLCFEVDPDLLHGFDADGRRT